MKRLIKNNKAVSEIIGYALSLGIMAILISGIYITVNAAIDEKLTTSGSVIAENIADHISDGVLNTIYLKENHPNSDYKVDLKVPLKIAGKSYYVKLTDDHVFVNTTDGSISESSTFFNVSQRACIHIQSDKIYGSKQYITISSKKSDYLYKFDFGGINDSSPWNKFDRFIRVSNNDSSFLPNVAPDIDLADDKFHNCTPVRIYNPTNKHIIDYPILIQLDPSNFNIFSASSNGNELEFYDDDGDKLDFWIERWNPWETSTSRIWVELEDIPSGGCFIYMYHGKDDADDIVSQSSGKETFEYFEDFDNVDNIYDLEPDWFFKSDKDHNLPYIEDGKLVLDATTGIDGFYKDCYAKFNKTKKLNGTIEAKVKCTGSQRDCSLFGRENGSYRYIFHSGLYKYSGVSKVWDKFNCSISVNYSADPTGHNQLPKVYANNNPSVSTDWNRLVFIMNGNDLVGGRYDYDDYRLNAYVNYNDSEDIFMKNHSDGYLGIINQKGEKSYVDWFFIRPYVGIESKSNPGTSYKDRCPHASIDGTISSYFEWNDDTGIKTKRAESNKVKDDLSKDCVYNIDGDPNTLRISNLDPGQTYSIIYTVGDFFEGTSSKDINMKITAAGKEEIIDLPDGKFKTDWFKVTPSSPDLDISFEGIGNGYWSICSLTIEEGERVVGAE